MDAFHSLWTKPVTSTGKSFSLSYFEIISAVLSALMWRKLNGDIFMVCDTLAYDFFKIRGLDHVWNKIIPILDSIPDSINPKTYWAAGKLFALRNFNAPIVGIDTDFLVWKKLEIPSELCVIHKEDISPYSYPDLPDFSKFAPDYNFSVKPSNTAFFYINDNEFLKLYTQTSIDFMSAYDHSENPLSYMLFAEQRLFSMCAEKLQKKVLEFSDLPGLFSEKNKTFTHLWGFKETLRKSPELEKLFCQKAVKRIIHEFPEMDGLFPEYQI